VLIFKRLAILSQILFWTGLCGNVGLAIAGPQVFIMHDPIQPDSSQQVTYTATASDPQGIKSIVISAQHRRFILYQGQKISEYISTTDYKVCSFPPPYPTSETCPVTKGPYSDGSHIGYRVTATSGPGEITTEGYIYFAAGAFPWPEDPIPIYVRGDQAEKIDLVFIPDEDYGQTGWEGGFMDDVTALVQDAFFSERLFAQEIRSRREMWNFYITYKQGKFTEPCSHTKPSNWTTLRATVNSGFIVHKTDLRDCSGIGDGSVFSAERLLPDTHMDYERSLTVPIHELGHSVFSLADEYSGGGLFQSAMPEHNVFPDKKSCGSNAQNHGWPRKNCKRIGITRWHRSDGTGDIMKDTSSADNAPGPSGKLRYDWHYDQCVNQNC
jgi:hypothetical protein